MWYEVVMKEIWEISILPYMLPVTVVLGLMLLFLAFSIIAGIGDGLDIDIDGGTKCYTVLCSPPYYYHSKQYRYT